MPGFFDIGTINIPCPGCGHKTAKTVRWLKANNHFTCRCGTRVNVQSDQFKRGIASAERSLDDFKRSLRNFGR